MQAQGKEEKASGKIRNVGGKGRDAREVIGRRCSFVAVHSVANGAKRTYQDSLLFLRLKGKADISIGVSRFSSARTLSVVRHRPTKDLRLGSPSPRCAQSGLLKVSWMSCAHRP